MIKPDPVVGMEVTWINPNEDPENRLFIKNRLIAKYGRKDLFVTSVENKLSDFIITLERRGKPILNHLDKDHLARFSWHYLRPV